MAAKGGQPRSQLLRFVGASFNAGNTERLGFAQLFDSKLQWFSPSPCCLHPSLKLSFYKSITYNRSLLASGLPFIDLSSECGGSSNSAILLGIGQCKSAERARFF